MEQQSKVSLENHPLIVDLKTARSKNAAALRAAARDQTEKPKKENHGIGFSVVGLVTGHTKNEKTGPPAQTKPKPKPNQAAEPTNLADTGFF